MLNFSSCSFNKHYEIFCFDYELDLTKNTKTLIEQFVKSKVVFTGYKKLDKLG